VLGAVDEVVIVDLIGDEVGLDLALEVVLLALLHHLEELPVALSLVVIQLLADEEERDEEDATRAREDYFLSIALALFFGLGFEAGPVAAFELAEGLVSGLAVDDPVDGVDDACDVEVAAVLLLELVVEVVLVLLSEGVQVGPHEPLYLLQLVSAHHVQALHFLLLLPPPHIGTFHLLRLGTVGAGVV
jgi:hypothetical protein